MKADIVNLAKSTYEEEYGSVRDSNNNQLNLLFILFFLKKRKKCISMDKTF